MVKKEREEIKVGPRGSPFFKGFKKVMVSLRPDQIERLHAEAKARADKAGILRPDASEIMREALDVWLAKRK